MSPELERAVKERIELGHTKEQITAELQAAGYDNATIETVYTTIVSTVTADPTTELIGYWQLVAGSVALLKQEWKLLLVSLGYGLGLLLAVGLIVSTAFALLESAPLVSGMFTVAALLAGLIGLCALMFGFKRALLMRRTQQPFLTHVQWVLPHILGLLLVSLYVQFAAATGYLLFIVPGIALTLYLSYAMLVRLTGTETGVMALVRSTELVYGRWWAVLGRTLFASSFFLLGMVPLFALMMYSWLRVDFMYAATGFEAMSSPATVLIDIFIPLVLSLLFFAAAILVAFLLQCTMILLFESLQETAVPVTPEAETKLYFWMRVAVIVGIPVTILINGADMYMQATNSRLDDSTFQADPTAFEQQLSAEQAAAQAELEAFMQEFEAELDSF